MLATYVQVYTVYKNERLNQIVINYMGKIIKHSLGEVAYLTSS